MPRTTPDMRQAKRTGPLPYLFCPYCGGRLTPEEHGACTECRQGQWRAATRKFRGQPAIPERRPYSRPCSQCGIMLTAETVNRDYRGSATGACQGRCEKDRLAIAQRASRIRRGRTAPEGPVRRPARYDAICLDCSCSAYQGFRGATCARCECPEDQHIEITDEVEE